MFLVCVLLRKFQVVKLNLTCTKNPTSHKAETTAKLYGLHKSSSRVAASNFFLVSAPLPFTRDPYKPQHILFCLSRCLRPASTVVVMQCDRVGFWLGEGKAFISLCFAHSLAAWPTVMHSSISVCYVLLCVCFWVNIFGMALRHTLSVMVLHVRYSL